MNLLKDITLGRYFSAHSRIHKLDPRLKIITSLLLLTTLFVQNSWASVLIAVTVVSVIIALTKIPISIYFNNLRPFLLVFVFTLGWHLLFVETEEQALFQIGFLKVTWGGIERVSFYNIRLALFIVLSSVLTLTTIPLDLTDGIESLLKPLKKFKLPVHEFAILTMIAMRFIPTILDETDRLQKAQKNRGAKIDGTLSQKARALSSLVIPLLNSTFRRAEHMAFAMDARCYDAVAKRTSFNKMQWQTQDTVAFLICMTICVMMLIF